MQIYCINLASATERREHIQTEFARLGLTPTFIDAVDGRALTEDEMRALVCPSARKVLTPGEIGCALSHLGVYERLLAENLDRALIIEDDIRLTPAFPAFFAAAQALPPDRADVLLGSSGMTRRMGRGRTLGGMTVYPVVSANCTYIYGITRTAAAKMLAGLRPVRTVADDWKHFALCGFVRVFGGAGGGGGKTRFCTTGEASQAVWSRSGWRFSSRRKDKNTSGESKERDRFPARCGTFSGRRSCGRSRRLARI